MLSNNIFRIDNLEEGLLIGEEMREFHQLDEVA